MINLFDNWDRSSIDLVRSQKMAGLKIPTVVINDDGFLPAEVDSPIKKYCQGKKGQPMYFDQVPVPTFWQIEGDVSGARVYDLNTKRADITFEKNDNTRAVKQVRWLNPAGQLQTVDEYNQFGHRFAKTFYANGAAKLKRFYDENDQMVIEQHLATGSVFLKTAAGMRHFASWLDMVADYLKQSSHAIDQIVYNTLNQSFFTTMELPENGSDILVWQEGLGDELPGNMQFIMKNQTRTKRILVQDHDAWQAHQDLFKDQPVKAEYLGTIYPHPRGNEMRPEILILTNSDQLEQLTTLVENLSGFNFHIAALTEMSDKLMGFGDYANVRVYPGVRFEQAQQLMRDCDVYLDINHGDEILDAVRAAFENNMLILGFNNVLHQPQFVAPENRYDIAEVDKLIQKLLTAIVEPAEMERLIDTQREFAGDTTAQAYQEAFTKGAEADGNA